MRGPDVGIVEIHQGVVHCPDNGNAWLRVDFAHSAHPLGQGIDFTEDAQTSTVS
ncbi:hypothetical protein ACFC06_10215 [Nocardia sp. NPDC056064]|uniref:hypothetical protein n=1 Tax=Nocardia sp. NPDC056064 TaxID=3345701 RepID=UPI0035DFFA24